MQNQDFFLALDALEREKGISRDEFISALEDALAIAYKKHTGDYRNQNNISTFFHPIASF